MLSQHFKLQEFEQSDKARELGINNSIESQEIKEAIKSLVDSVLQPLRDAWGNPLAINSGYRCDELNAAVGGIPTSQHVKGEAADVAFPKPIELARMAVDNYLPFERFGAFGRIWQNSKIYRIIVI